MLPLHGNPSVCCTSARAGLAAIGTVPVSYTHLGVCGVGIAYIDNDIQRIQQMRVVLDVLKADKLHIKVGDADTAHTGGIWWEDPEIRCV